MTHLGKYRYRKSFKDIFIEKKFVLTYKVVSQDPPTLYSLVSSQHELNQVVLISTTQSKPEVK